MLKALVTDVDGTITDRRRRINTAAIEAIRTLVDSGITVVLASGNTVCFMDGLCKMIGTDGTIIGENGGVYRRTFSGTLNISGDQKVCLAAFEELRDYFAEKGIELELFGAQYRFADVAFARNIDADEARAIIRDRHLPVRVLDTGFAIHLQVLGVNKGTALRELAGAGDSPGRDDGYRRLGERHRDAQSRRSWSRRTKCPGTDAIGGRLGLTGDVRRGVRRGGKEVLSRSLQQITVDNNIIFYILYRLERNEHLVPIHSVTISPECLIRFDDQVNYLPGIEIDHDVLESSNEHAIVTHYSFLCKGPAEGFAHTEFEVFLLFKLLNFPNIL